MLHASLCAKIMVFRRITRIIGIVLNERTVEFIRKYNLIIRQYNLNHSSMDYYRGLIEGGEKMKTITFIKNYLQWYFFNWGTVFILIAILIPIISIYIII